MSLFAALARFGVSYADLRLLTLAQIDAFAGAILDRPSATVATAEELAD
jgi:hypothetical protein